MFLARSAKLMLTLCLTAACLSLATQKQEKQEAPAAPQSSKAEVPDVKQTPALPVDPKSYVIGPEDVLFVQVWREPDITRPVLVRIDGKITLPLIGEVQAANLTPLQLGAKIKDGLSKFMVNPDVMVSVQQVGSKKYFVNGEVNRPGTFPLIVPTTVMEALSNCGGFKEFANQKGIIIMRGTKRLHFNYKEYVKGKKPEQNILLENGDTIVVR